MPHFDFLSQISQIDYQCFVAWKKYFLYKLKILQIFEQQAFLVNKGARRKLFSLRGGVGTLLDCPTQLFYIWIFVCVYTNLKDIAGQSARVNVALFFLQGLPRSNFMRFRY